MSEIFPLEDLLNQLSELYQQILVNQNKGFSVSPEILEKIHRLSREIDEISQMTNSEAARAGMSSEAIEMTVLGPKSQLPEDIQNFLAKSQVLKAQLEGCRNVLKEAMKKQKQAKASSVKGRRDKFKKLGGKRGWIPS